MSIPPRMEVPFSNKILLGSTSDASVCRLSSMPPRKATISDFTFQLLGTINFVPPQICVHSKVTVPLMSDLLRSISWPPNTLTASPPLKSLEKKRFSYPPKNSCRVEVVAGRIRCWLSFFYPDETAFCSGPVPFSRWLFCMTRLPSVLRAPVPAPGFQYHDEAQRHNDDGPEVSS